MHVYFIRHAQSENNALWSSNGNREGRSADPHITELGKKQANLIAEYLPQCLLDDQMYPININTQSGTLQYQSKPSGNIFLYSSLFIRSVETGLVIADKMKTPLRGFIDIHESGGVFKEDIDSGALVGCPGKSRKYFEENYPNMILPDGLTNSGWWNKSFEERPERRKRAKRVLKFLYDSHKGKNDTVIMISHQGFYNFLLREIFEVPLDSENWFELYNTAITYMQFRTSFINLVYQNNTNFLPKELIT